MSLKSFFFDFCFALLLCAEQYRPCTRIGIPWGRGGGGATHKSGSRRTKPHQAPSNPKITCISTSGPLRRPCHRHRSSFLPEHPHRPLFVPRHRGALHTHTSVSRSRGSCLPQPPPPLPCPRPERGGGRGRVDSKNSQTTPTTTSTSPIRQLLGAADAQTAHPATSSTAPTHQLLGSANAETTPAGAPAAAADRTQRPDATYEGKSG